jgi:hypothetical protein
MAAEEQSVGYPHSVKTEGARAGSQAMTKKLHEQLVRALKTLPGDYKPWGDVEREDPNAPGGWWADCSSGCRHYLVLADVGDEHISMDWGVCINPKSHRYGLLTFEHQGCPAFDYDAEERARLEAESDVHRKRYLEKQAWRATHDDVDG